MGNILMLDLPGAESMKKTRQTLLKHAYGTPHRQTTAQTNVVDKPNATDRNAMDHNPMYTTGSRP